jgi:hypothetical protein
VLWEQCRQWAARLGGVGLTRALAQTRALDRDGTQDRPNLRGVIPLTALGTLRRKIRRHLPLDQDLLQGLEDGFAVCRGEA